MRALTHRSSLAGITLVGALLAAACSSAGGGDDSAAAAATATERSALLDVNDVSILFNLDASGNTLPDLKVVGDNLLPAAVLDQVTAQAKALTPPIRFSNGGDDSVNWRVFAMRFDPCAPGINTAAVGGDLSKCSVQVRLIAQPITSTAPQDITMHLVYTIGTLDSTDIEPIRADLVKIKTASEAAQAPTAGQPLGVHPGLKKGDAATGNAVASFIKKYVPKQKSLAIAFMGLQNDGAEPWEFFAGAVLPLGPNGVPAAGGTPTFVNLAKVPNLAMPNLPAGSTNVVFQPFGSPVVSPNPVALSTAPLFAGGADSTSIEFQIENPRSTHFFSTDCVSCHTSTQKGFSLRTPSDGTRVRVPAGITGYVSPTVQQNSSWNLRNFGYFSTNASVSLRTVNETVEVVQLMNAKHRPTGSGSNFEGPGNDCTAADDAVFDCFRTNADGHGGATCMTKNNCKPLPIDPPAAPPATTPVPLAPLDPSNDPCLASADESGLEIQDSTITITGKANECFSRSFSGFDTQDPSGPQVSIACTAGSSCTVTLATLDSATTLTGTDAARLSSALARTSGSFTATTKDGVLSIACADPTSCTITPPAR